MSTPNDQIKGVVTGLIEFLEWQKEEGRILLEIAPENLMGLSDWGRPVTEESSASPSPAARPASAPKPAPVVSPLETGALRFVLAERMAECKDEISTDQTRMIVVSDAAAFEAEPFALLEKILKSIGYAVVEAPTTMESVTQVVDLKPLVILSMGNPSLKVFVPRGEITMMRGRWKKIHGVNMLCTFDPVYISSHSATKKAVWSDMQGLVKRLELNLPEWIKK